MSYRRRQQLHRVARRAAQSGRRPNPAGRNRAAAPLPPTSSAAAQPVLPPTPRTDAVGEPERDGAPSPHQGLDWARRTELAAVVLGVLLSPLIAAAGIWYANTQVRDQLKISSQELNTAQEGQITDRYTKAVETLGDDAMGVRLGGVYALQRIMQDSPRDHPTIANVLAAYVRTHAGKPPEKGGGVPADVHAALTVLVQRDATRDQSFSLDLRDTVLSGIELQPLEPGRTSTRAVIKSEPIGADLSGANLVDVDLSDANLSYANLVGTDLYDTDLSDANLSYADLRGALMRGADLSNVYLYDADLSGAYLRRADLSYANLTGAKLRNAVLSYADLRGADLRGADLRGAQGLQVREVISGVIDSTTTLPPGLASNPAVTARIAEEERRAEDLR